MKHALATASLAALFVCAGVARADNTAAPWPQWRGPTRNNISAETGLLKEWPKSGPPLLWKKDGLGKGFSDISVADGKIFTMGDLQDACYVFALGEDGKEIVWKAKVGPVGGGGGYAGPRCTPTYSDGSVVALGQFGDLVCLDAKTGAEKWRHNLERDFHGVMMSGWGYAESPLVDRGHVVCTPGGKDGTMLALNLQNGEPVWRSKDLTDPAAYASPVVAEIGGKHQYVQLTSESVSGVSAEDGSVLWRADRKGQTAVIPTPIVKGDEVFVTSGYGVGCNLFKIVGENGKLAAKEVYANKHMQNHHGGVVLVGDYIYGSSDPGILTCLNFEDGSVKWKDRSIGKGSLTCADGKLYLRSEGSGTVALIDATPDGYHLISQFDQPDRSSANAWPHPVIADGKLFLRDQDVLLCYDVKQH